MHRMTQLRLFTSSSSLGTLAVCAALFAMPVAAQSPMGNADYDASGYVTPAGMAHPSMYQGGVVPAGMAFSPGMQGHGPTAFPGGVMPVGFMSGGQCDGDNGSCANGCSSCGSGISRGGLIGSHNIAKACWAGAAALKLFATIGRLIHGIWAVTCVMFATAFDLMAKYVGYVGTTYQPRLYFSGIPKGVGIGPLLASVPATHPVTSCYRWGMPMMETNWLPV